MDQAEHHRKVNHRGKEEEGEEDTVDRVDDVLRDVHDGAHDVHVGAQGEGEAMGMVDNTKVAEAALLLAYLTYLTEAWVLLLRLLCSPSQKVF